MDRGRPTLALLAALAFAAAGCGDNAKSSAPTTVATTAADQQPPPTQTTAVKTPAAKQVEAMQRRLVRASLKAGDVGRDWQDEPYAAVRPVAQWCNRDLAGGLQPYAETGVAFSQKYGSIITQQLAAYAGNGARRVLADFRDLAARCSSWQASPEPGRAVTYTLTPLASKLGRDAAAVRLRSSDVTGGFEVRLSTVAVMTRHGQVIDLVTKTANAGLTQAPAEVLALAKRADRRLENSR